MKIKVEGYFENETAYEKHHIKVRYMLKILKCNIINCEEDRDTGKIIFTAESIPGTQEVKENGIKMGEE